MYVHVQDFLNAIIASSYSMIQRSNSSRRFLSKLASVTSKGSSVSKCRHVPSLACLVPTPSLVAVQQNILCAATVSPQGGRETESQGEVALAVPSDGFRDRFPIPLQEAVFLYLLPSLLYTSALSLNLLTIRR